MLKIVNIFLVLSQINDDKLNVYVGTDANLIAREGTRTRTIKMMNGNMLLNPMVREDKIWQDALISYMISKRIDSFYFWSWNPNSTDTK